MASASVIHPAAAASPPSSTLLASPLPRTHPFSIHMAVSFSKPKLHLLPPVVSATAVGASAQFLLSSPPPPAASTPFSQHFDYENPSFLCSGALSSSRTSIDEYLHLLHLAVRYSDVELVRVVHCRTLKIEEHALLSNTLIASYIKVGLISDAYGVFKGLSNPNVVSYTTLVSGFAKSRREMEAAGLFSRMRNSGIEPNEFTFVAILTACIRLLELELGLQVHALAIKLGYIENVFVSNALMGLYSKCGSSDFVLQLFGKMSERDAASWNVVILSALNERMYERAVELFREMWDTDGVRADYITLSTLLAACTDNFESSGGREIHAQAIRAGLDSRLSLSNAVISFYRKCGNKKAVEFLFNKMIVRDVITWTEMITAYMEFGLVDEAMAIFDRMPEKNVISYNTLLAGLCENGEAGAALDLFIIMVEKGLELTEFTLTTVVKACGSLIDTKLSEQIQGFITKFGLKGNVHVEAALLDMCTRCGRMGVAEVMFTRWSYNDVTSIPSTSMICGYARNGQPEEAISLFCRCQSEGTLVMDEIASTSVLGVTGTLGFHEMGQQIHCHAIKSGTVSHLELANAVVSMYSKCWNLDDALKVFRIMPIHDVASWNGLIAGHLLHWQGDEALLLWSKMKKLCIKPDKITFLLLLSAYKHTQSSLVSECHHLFLSMRTEYNIEPSQEHYACLVRVFSFWGFLERAYEVIPDMPFSPEPLVWRALLDGCILHSNTDIGRKAVKQLLAMEPQDPSSYILAANLYSSQGRWQCSDEVRAEMKRKGIQKFPARSWVIHQNKIVPFYTRDKSHPQAKDIYSGLDILILECLKAGYVPDTRFVLQEVEEHQKEHFLFYHSAKLAAAFGLLMTRHGKPVKIVKNICVCGDCHSFLKYASVVTNREILLRDSSGFHHFVSGHCSCKDHR